MTLHFTDNSNDVISKIDKNVLDYITINITPIKDKLIDYNLVITGTVGAGKSTRCEALYHIFKLCNLPTNPFPEYINNTDSSEHSRSMLKKKISGEVSPNTFQSYILDSWEKYLSTNDKPGLNLYERCVDDSFVCFCNIENKGNKLTEIQLLSLFERLKSINTKYNIPSYFDEDIHFTEILSNDLNLNLKQIVDIIISDVKSNVKKRIIGLTVSDYVSKERIKQRSRDGEDSYTNEAIRLFNSHYEKLFKLMSEHQNLTRMVDIGKLL